MRATGSNRRGVALIVVLLMVSIITALTIQLNRDTRSEVIGAANLSDGIRLRYIAQSGFAVGQALLLADRTAFDALTEMWANTEMIALQSEGYFDNGSFKLAIQDEEGKIAVNTLALGTADSTATRALLLRLLTGPFRLDQRKAEEIVDAIKDWIDTDDEVTAAGAEGAYYAGLQRPYPAKNAPIDCIEELLMVKGVTRELFYGTAESPGLAQCLSVYGDAKININTAPKAVLKALAVEMTDDDVNLLDKYRREVQNNLADAVWYQKVPRATPIVIPAGLIKVKSEIFRITAVGLQGRMSERITGVVKRGAGLQKAKLLSWKVE
ncbi:MAG: type II secretion system minor pseudopilin GspK [Proteobacteria bacterium]|nr:type II secretion system minor pseudopilin GspK [Pseudomonadota bacterium]